MLKSAAYHHRLAALFYKTRSFTMDMIFKRLYEDNISGKLTDERFHKLSDCEAEQAGLQAQAAILREEIGEAAGKNERNGIAEAIPFLLP